MHRQFKGKMLRGLLESEKKNSKEFWNSVNKLMERQKSDPSADISPEKWLDYFKSLMNIDYSANFTSSSNNQSRWLSGRASASGSGGRGFESWPAIPKALKLVSVATLLGAQHYKASTGLSSPNI